MENWRVATEIVRRPAHAVVRVAKREKYASFRTRAMQSESRATRATRPSRQSASDDDTHFDRSFRAQGCSVASSTVSERTSFVFS